MIRLCLSLCLVLLGLAMGPIPALGDGPEGGKAEQTTRYIRVRNYTDEVLTVHLRYRGDGAKAWLPAGADNSLTYRIRPRQTLILEDAAGPVAARQIRVWAESPTARWVQYKNQNIDIVPRPYRAACLGTFTYVFRK
jgi:hypothetical protein